MESEEEESTEALGGNEGECEEEVEDADVCNPPPDEKEMLFLIEFLVDTMLLKPDQMDIGGMDPCLLQGPVSIILTFLYFPPMTICETDSDPNKQTGLNLIKFNSGKSLTFALSESQLQNPPPINLEIFACKMLPHGTVPNSFPIGKTKICLVELFKQVFDKIDQKPDQLPLSKSIKDKYTLIGTTKKCPAAEITIYIRLSYLGQNVVTEFQRGDECEPFLFKNKESKKVYECKPKEVFDDNLCPPLPGWGSVGDKDCGDCEQRKSKPCGASAARPRCQASSEAEDDDEYDEFGTEVQGHALTIKIHRPPKRQDEDVEGGKSCTSTKADGEGGEGSGAGTEGQVGFQVPKSQNICKKVKGESKAKIFKIDTSNDPTAIQGIDCPDKDVFVLRIGRKGEEAGKGKLELELRTPKPKVERPLNLPRKCDKAVQTDVDEDSKKGKKKK